MCVASAASCSGRPNAQRRASRAIWSKWRARHSPRRNIAIRRFWRFGAISCTCEGALFGNWIVASGGSALVGILVGVLLQCAVAHR